jgi:hypothetical protein
MGRRRAGVSSEEIIEKDFPDLTIDDIHACIAYANQLVRTRRSSSTQSPADDSMRLFLELAQVTRSNRAPTHDAERRRESSALVAPTDEALAPSPSPVMRLEASSASRSAAAETEKTEASRGDQTCHARIRAKVAPFDQSRLVPR